MKAIITLLFLSIFCSGVYANTYYVAPTGGSDSNPGTINSPWATWAHAFETAKAGDIVYFRGGVWYTTNRILVTIDNGNSGTESNYIKYFAYPGEVPILDCINKTVHGEALFLSGINYVHLKGLTIRNNKETSNDDLDANGFAFQFSIGLIVENCTSYGNGCRGFYLAEVASATVLNCDSYNNISERSTGTFPGNHGEGLILTGTNTGQPFNGNVTITGCRAWGNSDSGFGSNCGGVETWINNWSFDNGRLQGEGCGFKYLPGAWLGTGVLSRIMHNNIAAHNGYGTSNHGDNAGFTENGAGFNLPNLTFDNNFSYGNYTDGYSTFGGLNGARAVRLMRNNVSYKDPESHIWYVGNPPTDTYNSWNNPPNLTLSDADFISLDYTQLAWPRKADGSLPDITFGKLATGSRLIDAGTFVGLPFDGTAPDLGYAEFETGSGIPGYQSSVIENATPAVLEMTYNMNLANIVPSTTAFAVMVNSAQRAINLISISGAKVLLTLSSPIVYGDVVTVAYTKPTLDPLQTPAGDQAVTITAKTVINNVSPPIPVYINSVIENSVPNVLEMTYNLNLANILPSTTSFTVSVNSVQRTVSAISISGMKVLITLSSPVAYGDAITLAYTKPSTNPLQTAAGGQAAALPSSPVTNNVNPAIPVYQNSAIENATPAIVEISYNLNLANIIPSATAFSVSVNSVIRTVTVVSISGNRVMLSLSNAVVYGDIVTVSYTKPGSNPLQTISGGQAASFTTQPVTNRINPALPVYVSSSVENATPSVVELTYSISLANIVPATSAFVIMVNSVQRAKSAVSISGTKVLITLSGPVAFGDVVTVAYTKPSLNPLQTAAGGQAATLATRSVTNNLNPAIPIYQSSAIENATPAILEITYNSTLANIVPSTTAFTVLVNSVTRSVSAVAISGTRVLLTLSSVVLNGDLITVAYAKPGTNPLQTTSGGQAATFPSQTVVNKIGTISPAYLSSVVENSSSSIIEITYNLSLANILPATSSFVVSVSSAPRSVTAVAVSGSKVRLTLSSPVIFGDAVTVAYNAPSVNQLQTQAGGLAATMSAQIVTNNVLPAMPLYMNSQTGSAFPDVIEMIYSLNLANILPSPTAFAVTVNNVSRTVVSVSISGSSVFLTLSDPILYGDIITVAYTKPSANLLQTSDGVQAISMNAQPVINNINPIDPIFQTSAIENSNPSELQILYNLALANIVPPVSAFNVLVNSVAREVNSVLISDNVVKLNLSSPVVYGDKVTISYTKPPTNPLQALSLRAAPSLNGQVVNNKVERKNIQEGKGITVYPNPASEFVTIHLDELTPDLDFFQLMDLSGKVLFFKKVNYIDKEFSIPVNLKNGIYIIQIGSGKQVAFTQKLIIVNK